MHTPIAMRIEKDEQHHKDSDKESQEITIEAQSKKQTQSIPNGQRQDIGENQQSGI